MTAPATRRRSGLVKKRYLFSLLGLAATVLVLGWFLNGWMTRPMNLPPTSGTGQSSTSGDELASLFAAAVEQMQQGRHRQAMDLWHRALLLDPDLPEIRVNMGFSLYELGEHEIARDFFSAAMERDPYQANAYYGLALTSEKLNDLEGALGAMRSYIHLAANREDEKYLRLARAAIWEWEARVDERRQSGAAAVTETEN